MSDLISRSEVLELLYKIFDKYNMSTDKHASVGKSFGIDVFKEIKKMPTAYNIDKVVEELKERTDFLNGCTKYGNKDAKQQTESYSTMMMYEVAELVDDLIEIVKQGGVADDVDVCECRELKDYNSLLKTSCGYVFGLGKEFKYCPSCGKKIKVIQNDN